MFASLKLLFRLGSSLTSEYSIDTIQNSSCIIAADFNNLIIIIKSAEYMHSSTLRKLMSVPIVCLLSLVTTVYGVRLATLSFPE